ncbi:MAG: DsrE family protein [Candidatus Thiodiazotropha sp. (ex Lucinoma kastoroae)]|nr:DsrE family protein [Candidatus Thiodiazotropha sp. (ex Lucinoma kastoroae)]MCU7861762.1 DsrE family protein [Candidatus Thiodiazotropha sp. (ex Lucinoma kastoroae)]
MDILIILNGPPYGTERSYNGLRLAKALILNAVIRKGEVLLCGTCMDARGITDEDIAVGTRRSTMQALAERTLAADKVLVF